MGSELFNRYAIQLPQMFLLLIYQQTNLLSVSNIGTIPLEQPEKIFSRFYRESDATKSTGLGLAIVKQICELYCFKIDYNFAQGKHFFAVKVR